ncbi:MAG TPA: hypothetical protein PLV10_09720, partial [Candidatus Latescibacteria bacterium]|nr:hypothetical protein [Candidatus Latescibacterota bacterium]
AEKGIRYDACMQQIQLNIAGDGSTNWRYPGGPQFPRMSDRRMSWWNGKKLPFPIETDAPHGDLEKAW